MLRFGRFGVLAVVVLGVGPGVAADEKGKGEGRLRHVESVVRDDLDAVVAASISPDGKFLYAASWKPATATVFARDPKTGHLEHTQTIADANVLGGTTALTVSPDGRLAIASAFQSKTAVLFTRNADTGELTQVDVARDGEKDVKLTWPIDAAFSLDSKFAYILDDNGTNGQGGVLTFRVADGTLELVALDEGQNGCYAGARGIAFHPDGKTIFLVSHRASGLIVADRDEKTGKTSVRQVIKDEEGEAHALAGAMGVVVSPDGRSVYVSSGRFEGDNAISAFKLGNDGRLAFLEEFVNGGGDLQGFEGGNHLAISPDGLNVYAASTRLASVACFRRDPATGTLRYLETIPDGGGEGGEGAEFGAAALAISPDGKFVYVATEDKKALAIFARETGQ